MEKTVKCPYASKCGGCNFINEEYEKSLEGKKKEVSKLLEPFFKVTIITGMDNPFFYRNMATCSFGMDRKGHSSLRYLCKGLAQAGRCKGLLYRG